ncbi:putative salivary secreted peptide [Haematobia irritans]|uniref:putative salivary secreted peptide n=1 Tax=Haematobia irritans TaxID=7368 RepID=UPI003F4FE739
MAFWKFTLAFVVLFVGTMAMNASWGSSNTKSVLLLNETIVRSATPGTYTIEQVVYPIKGHIALRTISAIYVYDYLTNSPGTTPSLLSGGPGHNLVIVNLQSQYGKGINSTIEIWGKLL